MIRILITDDHPLFRKGMRTLLTAVDDFEVVAEASSGPEAIASAAELRPDLVLMDLQMAGGGGIAATRELVTRVPDARVLVVSLFEDDDSVFMALRAGARGYILKDAEEEEMIRAVRAVAAGQAIFSPAIAARVLAFFAAGPSPREAFPELTAREREILGMIAQGCSNQTIAERLFLSPKTVANHVSSIFAKLRVADRAGAIVRAREAGFGDAS
jgi:DNA-binding NarL/FixJ family response regulator